MTKINKKTKVQLRWTTLAFSTSVEAQEYLRSCGPDFVGTPRQVLEYWSRQAGSGLRRSYNLQAGGQEVDFLDLQIAII